MSIMTKESTTETLINHYLQRLDQTLWEFQHTKNPYPGNTVAATQAWSRKTRAAEYYAAAWNALTQYGDVVFDENSQSHCLIQKNTRI